MTQASTLVALATYNEIENLPCLVNELFGVLPDADILVVDDNSPDGTGRWCDEQSAVDSRIHCLHRSGKLGLGTAIIAGQYHSCLLEDGHLSCWGRNDHGQLGVGDKDNRLTAVPVAAARTFSEVCGGESHGCALEKSTGAVLCWGDGSAGQLGDPSLASSLVPKAVPLPKAEPQGIPSASVDLPVSLKPKATTSPYKYKAYGEK